MLKINDFPLLNYKKFFFDIFFKNNKLYIICPDYIKPRYLVFENN